MRKFTIDRRIVLQALPVVDPGTWVAQILSPPNLAKGGIERGWVDGLKVPGGNDLRAEVIEVKSRRTEGCCEATRDAVGYVNALNDIAAEIKRVSELATATGKGLRADPRDTRKSLKLLDDMLRGAGIDVTSEKMVYAWRFYHSLQNALGRTFTTPFSSVGFKVSSGGVRNTSYWLEPPLHKICKDKDGEFWGIERVVFEVNQLGGLSYGCEEKCDRRRKRSKEEEASIASYEARLAGKTGAPSAEIEILDEPEEEAQKLRPAAVTALVPELQQAPIVREINANLRTKFPSEPSGRQFYLVASPQFVREFIGKPRAQRAEDLLKVRTPPALGFRAVGSQILFWFYGVPMAIAIIFVTGGLAADAEAGGGAVAGEAGGVGTLMVETLRSLGTAAANDNAIKVMSAAAGVVLTLAIARTASADEPDWRLQESLSMAAVPVDQIGAGRSLGDEVQDKGITHIVVGSAQVP